MGTTYTVDIANLHTTLKQTYPRADLREILTLVANKFDGQVVDFKPYEESLLKEIAEVRETLINEFTIRRESPLFRLARDFEVIGEQAYEFGDEEVWQILEVVTELLAVLGQADDEFSVIWESEIENTRYTY